MERGVKSFHMWVRSTQMESRSQRETRGKQDQKKGKRGLKERLQNTESRATYKEIKPKHALQLNFNSEPDPRGADYQVNMSKPTHTRHLPPSCLYH